MSHNVSTYSQKSFTLLLPGNKVALQEIFKTQKALKCSAKDYKRDFYSTKYVWNNNNKCFLPIFFICERKSKDF